MKEIPELSQKKNFLGKIASWLIDKYRVVYLLILLIFSLGIFSYSSMPKESFPDMEINYIFVTTVYPGASVQDVEKLVSEKIEDGVEGVTDLKKITSTSSPGFSQVVIEFNEKTDMDQAKVDVKNIVDDIKFADGVMDSTVLQMKTGEIPIMNFTVTGNYDLIQLNDYAELLEGKFESLSGVKKVDVSGGKEREIRLSINQNLLYEYGVSISDISNALQSNNIQLPLGDASLDQTNYTLRVDEVYKTIDQLKRTIITTNTGGTVFLADVAQITDSFKTPTSMAYTYTTEHSIGEKATPVITMSLYRETGADIIGISNDIKALIDKEKGTLFPEDLNIIITSDDSETVADDLGTVKTSALGGLLVVVAVLFVFIGLNESLIVALVIPLSLLISLSVMNYMGITINSMSLVAFVVALGLLVDNAIVVMENIDRLRDEGLSRIEASKIGTNQVAPAVLAATATTVGAFIPLATQGGSAGQFISILPKTLIITILSSFIVSIAVTPNLSSRFLSKYKMENKPHSILKDRLSVLFVWLLTFIAFLDDWKITIWTIIFSIAFTGIVAFKIHLRERKHRNIKNNVPHKNYIDIYMTWLEQFFISRFKRWSVFVISLTVLILALCTIPLGILNFEFFPKEEPSSISIDITAPEGFLLEDTYEVTQFVEKELYSIEDLDSFDIIVGGNKKNEASITVNLVDKDLRKSTGYDSVEYVRSLVKTIPGAEFDVKGNSGSGGFHDGGDADISVGLKGEDLNVLNATANEYLSLLSKMDGVDNPTISSSGGVKEITVDIDENKLSHYGLTVNMIANDLRGKISGITVGSYKEAGETYDITVYYSGDNIQSISDFDNILFTNQKGDKIPFSAVASLKIVDGMSSIEHEDGYKVVKVTANVKNGYNATTVGSEFNKIIANVELPDGVETSSGGAFENTNEQTSEMIRSFIIAIFIVYMILVIQFNSFMQPFVILMSIPFSLIGVILGLVITGNNLGAYAMMGVVALVGIAVNDAIVLIDYANYKRSLGLSIKDAIMVAVKTRFLPVFATSLTTMGGILPLALYNETYSQLGYVIVFGLFASTVLTLLIIPLMYYMIEQSNLDRLNKKLLKRNKGDGK